MTEKNLDSYNFGEFYLDAGEKILRRGGEVLPLAPKVAEVLLLLVERDGKMVSKTELMETVWADSFVEESNLTQSIYSLRRVLGKGADGKNFIETVPRRGYRFAAPVRRAARNESPPLAAAGAPQTETADLPASKISQKDSERLAPAAVNPIVSRFGREKWLIAAGVGAAMMILLGVAGNRFFSPQSAASAPIENVTYQRLTFTGDATFPVISPDGKSFACIRENSIYLQDIDTGSSYKLNIPDQKVFGNLQFSVDNESIFFRNENSFDAGGTLFQVSRFGGAAKPIAENVWSTVGFSFDGRQMAFMRFFPSAEEWALIVRNAETGEERKLISRFAPFMLYRTGFPAWSRDGKKIAAVEQTPNQKNISRLVVVNAETGWTETLDTPRFVQIEQVAWQPEDAGLIVTGREDNSFFQLWTLSYPQGKLRKITNDLMSNRTISLSADGTKLLARQLRTYSHIWTATEGNFENRKQITFGNLNRDGWSGGLNWTGDNQTIIYSSRITGDTDLYSVRIADGARRQLTQNAGKTNESQVLSPDDKYIYFVSTRTGARRIWRIDVNGENPVQMTFGENVSDYYPAVSPDGNWLYFIKKARGQNGIWRKSLTGDDEPEQITEAEKFSPHSFIIFSPDGKRIAFKNFIEKGRDAIDGKNIQVAIVSIDKSSEPKFYNLAANVSKISWAVDDSGFDYIENSAQAAKIWRQNFAGGDPQLILNLPNMRLYDFNWSADGKSLVLACGKDESDVTIFRNFE